MFKPVVVSAETIKQAAQPLPADAVNNIFKVMHGFYGNLFLSKFSTGALNDAGEDSGIVSARQIWGHGLREFNPGIIKTALSQCMGEHPEFPPSLPQFVALCKANRPRETFASTEPARPSLEMSQKLRSKYAAQAREIQERHRLRTVERITGYVELPPSLDGLKLAVAGAIAAAGGDEAAELLRLDAQLACSGVAA